MSDALRCDVCHGFNGVDIVSHVLEEAISAGVHRMCAKCNSEGAKELRRIGVIQAKDESEAERKADDRKRQFVKYLKARKAAFEAKRKKCATA